MSAGVVSGRTFVSSDSAVLPDHSVGGGGIALDALFGLSPSAGFATGGAFGYRGFGYRSGESANLFLLGAFADGFPIPSRGFHFGGALALALATTSERNGYAKLTGYGPGMSAWIGHGVWVADDWTLGALLRFDGAFTYGQNDDPVERVDLSGSTYSLGFLVSALYH
jgi:hypothetical protein